MTFGNEMKVYVDVELGDKGMIVDRMKDWSADTLTGGEPAKNETIGKVEEKLGSVTGCEGMVGEGKERQN